MKKILFKFILIVFIFSWTTSALDMMLLSSYWQNRYENSENFEENMADRETRSSNKQVCEENKLMLELAKLQIVSPEKIILLVSSFTLDDVCNDVEQALKRIKGEYVDCKQLDGDNLYMRLYKGLQSFDKSACQKDKRNSKIKRIQICIQELYEELIDCEGPVDWFEGTNKTTQCQMLMEILNCNYIPTARLCGLEAAKILRALSLDIFKAVIPVRCSLAKSIPKVKNPMPPLELKGTSSYSINHILLIVSLLLILSFK